VAKPCGAGLPADPARAPRRRDPPLRPRLRSTGIRCKATCGVTGGSAWQRPSACCVGRSRGRAVDHSASASPVGSSYWNHHAEDLYGWRAEEALGRSILELTPSNQSREQATEIMDRLKRGERWSGDFLVQRRDAVLDPRLSSEGVSVQPLLSDLTPVARTPASAAPSIIGTAPGAGRPLRP
jgi:PAS fold